MSVNVIALGGNAILDTDPTSKGQKEQIKLTVEKICDLIESNEKVVITHGNGPQVGNLLLQQKAADSDTNPALELDSCGAMTQGSIGYWMQNAMKNELNKRGINKDVVSLITQVIVSEDDKSFSDPTKPIGPFYTKEEADKLATSTNSIFKEDSNRGYRKVVASPMPLKIVESEAVKSLVSNDFLTICGGGGGVPVIEKNSELIGVEAVNDKDFTATVLACEINADNLIILTGVDNIYINFGKPDQEALHELTVSKANEYIKENHFAAGSMLPKIEAAIMFVENNKNRKAIITSISNLANSENPGTVIISD